MFKMMLMGCFMVLILSSPMYVNTAPSNTIKENQPAQTQKVNDQTPQLEHSNEADHNNDKLTTSGVRHKRFFNYYSYGFPPINPVIYSNGIKRDGSTGYNVPGINDPFQQIYQRLQEISGSIRYSAPFQPQFPVFFPVIFVPSAGCGCNPNNSTPGIDSRFPALEDSRQNWGLIIGNNIDRPSVNNEDYDEDISRPISFDPVRPNRPQNRPAPPVEHGSTQAGSVSTTVAGGTPAAGQGRPTNQGAAPTTFRPALAPRPSQNPSRPATARPIATTNAPNSAPTACDTAILSCCHQPQITFNCFASQGCTDPASLGAPCDSNVILSVIQKFQRFYGQRT